MESEKVKEIKEALAQNSGYIHFFNEYEVLDDVAYTDILTLINELEKENKKLLDSIETVQNDRCVYKCELTKKHLKQFAERLKEKRVDYYTKGVIDETLKEFIKGVEVEE